MIRVAIDGACRRNGTPTCIAAGGVFVVDYDKSLCLTISDYEVGSTNQRGELIALLAALKYILKAGSEAQIITDSEYLFNTMTKEWHVGWRNRNWYLANGSPVKNADLWKKIVMQYEKCTTAGIEITFYHIKGHVISFGEVTASRFLEQDPTGATLLEEVKKKFAESSFSKKANMVRANELSEKNNGFALTDDIMKTFVCMNVMADAVATKCVDAADLLWYSK